MLCLLGLVTCTVWRCFWSENVFEVILVKIFEYLSEKCFECVK